MATDIQAVTAITYKIFPKRFAYVVWDIDNRRWFGAMPGRTIYCNAVWNDPNLAKEDVEDLGLSNYEVVELEMETIHQDLIRIVNLNNKYSEQNQSNMFTKEEQKKLISAKLEQIFKVYIFGNKELKERMLEAHRGK